MSHNSLKKFPDVPKWPENLQILDLSFNKLVTLPPDHVEAPNLRQLDISNNNLSKVPASICSFVNLTDLNLSNNPSILDLPLQMGRLFKLQRLELSNLELRDPPRDIRKNTRECIDYLYVKLRNAKSFYHMKVLVAGPKKTGKTTLVQSLTNKKKERNQHTNSRIEVSQWSHRSGLMKQTFSFETWDFNGPNAASVQCLFYCHQTLYLLVFDQTDKTNSIKELRGFLERIAARAPFSMVVLVATHNEAVGAEQSAVSRNVLGQVKLLVKSYKDRLVIVEDIIQVSLKNVSSNLNLLKNLLYNNAAKYKTHLGREVMGLKVPATYHDLDKKIRSQQEIIQPVPVMHNEALRILVPVMHKEDLRVTIKQMNITSIMQDDPELLSLAGFLTDRGSLISYNIKYCNVDDVIFTDPSWLYRTATTIMAAETIPNRALLLLKNVLHLLNDINQFKYIDQLLVTLDDFEVALLMGNQCMLIPSALPDHPDNMIQPFKSHSDHCCRYIVYDTNKMVSIPWSRLLSMVIYMIPRLNSAFTKIVSSSAQNSQTGISIPQPRHSSHGNPEFFSSVQSLDMSSRSLDMVTSYSVRRHNRIHNASERAQSWSSHRTESSSLSPVHPKVASDLEVESVQYYLLESKFMPHLSHTPPTDKASNDSDSADNSELIYWKSGLHFRNSYVDFQMESLADCSSFFRQERDGILITVSSNAAGRQLTGQVVEVIHDCINQWCTRAVGRHNSAVHLDQFVPCPKCIKTGQEPYEFKFDECLSLVTQNELSVTCGYHGDKNHSILLADIFPDLLCKDMQPDILLDPNELCCEDTKSSFTSGTQYSLGSYHDKTVLLKTFQDINKEGFRQLRHEASILQRVQHPCIVQLIGATLYPTMTLVMEAPPIGFLDQTLLNIETPIHRLTVFRIAAEVAAALSFIHSKGLVYNILCAANVLLWSLDPKSICHCKLVNFDAVLRKSFIGVYGSRGTVGFTAPEVLKGRQSKQHNVYSYKADIFSFGMFLYQLIARQDPFSGIPKSRVDGYVRTGRRPDLSEVSTSYHYLCRLMRSCWAQNPDKRPPISLLIKALCSVSTQAVMSISPMEGRIPVCNAVAVSSSDMNKIGAPSVFHSEMWVCCNGIETAEISVYNTHTMTLLHKIELPDKEVCHMLLCGMYMWVVLQVRDQTMLQAYTVACCEPLTVIDSLNGQISCITAGRDEVFIGTVKGYCYTVSNSHVGKEPSNAKFLHIKVSEHKIFGIAWSNGHLWLSHRHKITIIHPRTLEPVSSTRYSEDHNWIVGSLIVSPAGDLVWSAHIKESSHLCAWNALTYKHVFDIDVAHTVSGIQAAGHGGDCSITAVTPVLDTVWVGTSSGHIFIYQHDQLLLWYHSYSSSVRFLTAIYGPGPCGTERGVVLSGGNEHVQSLAKDIVKGADEPELQDGLDYLITWEAYDARTLKQVDLVQQNAPMYLDSYGNIRQMLFKGEFEDGTCIPTAKKT